MPFSSLSLISMLPRWHIPSRRTESQQDFLMKTFLIYVTVFYCLLTEADGFGGPEAIGLAWPGWGSQQDEARATGVPHHRAHPPVITVNHSVIVRIRPAAVHWHMKRTKIRTVCYGFFMENERVDTDWPLQRDLWPSQQQLESPQGSFLSSWWRALHPPKHSGADPDQ